VSHLASLILNKVRTISVIFSCHIANALSHPQMNSHPHEPITADHISDLALKSLLARVPEPSATDPPLAADRLRERTTELNRQYLALQAQLTPNSPRSFYQQAFHLRMQRNLLYWRVFRINDLPPEILANIFRYIVWSTAKPEVGVQYRLWLSAACRHWRNVALADSTLWNAIWFRDLPPYERSLTWFERAGDAPLDLRINERDANWNNKEDEHKFTGEEMASLLDKLFTKLPQIRMFIVIVDTWPPALAVLDKLRTAGERGVPINMERFELHRAGRPYVWIGPGYEPDTHRNPIPLCGGKAPNLKYVCLNSIHVDWYKSPLANLTTLDLRRMALEVAPSLMKFRDMLKACPDLYKLALDGFGPKWEPREAIALPPIEFPKLVILVIGDFSLQYAFYVVAQIKAPNVRDLTMMNMTGEDYSHLIKMMTGRFPEVRLLTLYTIEVADSPEGKARFVRWLHSMPHMSYLRIAQIRRSMLDAFMLDPSRFAIPAPSTSTFVEAVAALPPVSNAPPASSTTTFAEAVAALPPVSNAPAGSTPRTRNIVVPTSNPANPRHQILCPKFDILEYQTIDTEHIVALGKGRRSLGIPLRKIYVNAPWTPNITDKEQEELRSIARLYITPTGANTPEEDELLS
jgi:hypothetical protein